VVRTGDVATIDPMVNADHGSHKDLVEEGGEWISSVDWKTLSWRIQK